MKISSTDWLKWNWVDLPSWGQDIQIWLQSNLTPAWPPCVSSIWFDSRHFLGFSDIFHPCPSRVTVWKSTLTFFVGFSRLPPTSPSHPLGGCFTVQMTSLHCPCLSGLAVWCDWLCTAVRSTAKYQHQVYLDSRQQRETENFSLLNVMVPLFSAYCWRENIHAVEV